MAIDFTDFDYENEICRRLNKIHGVAELFFCELREERRELPCRACNGIHNILEDTAKELREIYLEMWKEAPHGH